MYKKTIKYTDYNNVEREEDFYFNLTKAELAELELSKNGGLENMVNRIISTRDTNEICKLFKEIIWKSYGVKSDDGRRFIKTDQIKEEFTQTEAYSILFMELASDDTAAAAFINGIIPGEATNNVVPMPPSK